MLKDWPTTDPALDFPEEAKRMEGVMEVIRAVRNLRAEMNVQAGKRTRLMLMAAEGWAETLAHAAPYFQRLAGASASELIASAEALKEKTVSAVASAGTLYIPLGDLVDIEKEIARLEKDKKGVEGEIARANAKLNNPGFVAKAPAQLVEQEKDKLKTNAQLLEKLDARIAEMMALR